VEKAYAAAISSAGTGGTRDVATWPAYASEVTKMGSQMPKAPPAGCSFGGSSLNCPTCSVVEVTIVPTTDTASVPAAVSWTGGYILSHVFVFV